MLPVERYFNCIRYITEYRDECLFAPDESWNSYDFKRRSWKRAAVDELLRRLQVNINSGVDPYDIIDYYWRELDEYYEMSDKNQEQRQMFDAMKNAVFDIGLVFV